MRAQDSSFLSCLHLLWIFEDADSSSYTCYLNSLHLSLIPARSLRFEKAVAQVFGRTALCRNMEVAVQAARGNDVDSVTIDGDQV